MILQFQNNILIEILLIVLLILPLLLAVAYLTVFERKALARMQRRVGPETTGPEGVLQAFADALKLELKEQVIPSHSNKIIFYIAPISTLIFSLLNWIVVPLYPGLAILDFSLSILFILALSSLGVYGILFIGWSSNSKYAFLGSLRSAASMISYELILSTGVLIIILSVGSFNLERIIESQSSSWNIFSNIVIFVMVAISLLAETGRTPFDLPEAESEIVAGHLTETSSTIFVSLYLAEYNAILFYSCFMSILFFGGTHIPFLNFFSDTISETQLFSGNTFLGLDFFSNVSPYFLSLISGVSLGIKTVILSYLIYILTRGTLPRVLFSKLIEFSWSELLPAAMALFAMYLSLYSSLEIVPTGLALFSFLPFSNAKKKIVYNVYYYERTINNFSSLINSLYFIFSLVFTCLAIIYGIVLFFNQLDLSNFIFDSYIYATAGNNTETAESINKNSEISEICFRSGNSGPEFVPNAPNQGVPVNLPTIQIGPTIAIPHDLIGVDQQNLAINAQIWRYFGNPGNIVVQSVALEGIEADLKSKIASYIDANKALETSASSEAINEAQRKLAALHSGQNYVKLYTEIADRVGSEHLDPNPTKKII